MAKFPSALRATTLFAGALTAAGIGVAATSAQPTSAGVHPTPQTTYLVGSSTGPLILAENTSVAAGALALEGAAVNSKGATGNAGYGLSHTVEQYGTFGGTFGPAGVGVYGRSYYPEAAAGPASTNQTTGVYGVSSNGDGVVGTTAVQHAKAVGGYAGVLGADTTTNTGYNSGVLGTTDNGAFGVEGVGGNGSIGGLYGYANGGTYGVYGASSDIGVYGAGSKQGIVGRSTGYPIVAQNDAGTAVLEIDSDGNIITSGKTYPLAAARDGETSRAFVPSSTTPRIEDVGTASMVNGVAVVRLEPTFASSISTAVYQVFLTPGGESNGLYVTGKTSTGFVVRENKSGRSTLAFDYRIVATPFGENGRRIVLARSKAELGMTTLHSAIRNVARDTQFSPSAGRTLPESTIGTPLGLRVGPRLPAMQRR